MGKAEATRKRKTPDVIGAGCGSRNANTPAAATAPNLRKDRREERGAKPALIAAL
jgi:hypothetical protein